MPATLLLSILRSETGAALGMRPAEEVFAAVSHRQWVLTMLKRLDIFFRYDRRL
jgi:hypothetical protein